MKGNLILFILIFLSFAFLPIPKYVELNNLNIIKTITVDCDDDITITLEEVLPLKKENGIQYQCKEYQENDNSAEKAKKRLEDSNKKVFFYNDVEYLYTNCSNIVFIKRLFNIHPQIKPLSNKKANSCN